MALLILVEQEDLRTQIQGYLQNLKLFKQIYITDNTVDARQIANEHLITMFIIEMTMKDGSGRTFVDTIRLQERYKFTWTLMIGECAESCHEIIDSYNTSVCHRFIIKPIEVEYLATLVKDLLGKRIISIKEENRLRIKRKSIDYFFDHEDIIFIETVEKMAYIFTADNKFEIGRVTLKELEDLLDSEKFMRIHRSYIINTDYIDFIKKRNNQNQIKIKHYDHMIPVGRTYKGSIGLV